MNYMPKYLLCFFLSIDIKKSSGLLGSEYQDLFKSNKRVKLYHPISSLISIKFLCSLAPLLTIETKEDYR